MALEFFVFPTDVFSLDVDFSSFARLPSFAAPGLHRLKSSARFTAYASPGTLAAGMVRLIETLKVPSVFTLEFFLYVD